MEASSLLGESTVQNISRLVAGVVFTAGMILLPAAGAIHAAAKTGTAKTASTGSPTTPFTADYIASVEGVSTATLNQDLQAGETLLQIAGSKYGSAADLAIALMAPVKQKLDHAAASGKVSAKDLNAQYAALLQATETLVVTPHPVLAVADGRGKTAAEKQNSPAGAAFGNAKSTIMSAAAASCNTTADALIGATNSGNASILSACQTTNPSATVDSVSAAIMTAVKAQLDAAVKSGAITAGDESSFLSDLQTNLSTMLTSTQQTSGGKQKS
jgi:hypothetical protein